MAEQTEAKRRIARDVPQEILDILNLIDWAAVSDDQMKQIRQGVDYYLVGMKLLPLKQG